MLHQVLTALAAIERGHHVDASALQAAIDVQEALLGRLGRRSLLQRADALHRLLLLHREARNIDRACDAGEPRGCATLGTAYMSGIGVAVDDRLHELVVFPAGHAPTRYMCALRVASRHGHLRQHNGQALVDQELHGFSGRSSNAVRLAAIGFRLRQSGFRRGRPRRG